MSSVGIHPPKTPVTKGSSGIAKATLPNICKMPGPPAPFIPSPLPNIAKSGSSPKGYSKKVKIEKKTVAIRGASFKSMGDMASKGTGGGLISANTHGPAKFITPGSLTVKIEGKSVHLLGEPMLNNCGASGMPPNTGATLMGVNQATQSKVDDCKNDPECRLIECKNKKRKDGTAWSECDYKQFCAKINEVNKQMAGEPGAIEPGYSFTRPEPDDYHVLRAVGNAEAADFRDRWNESVSQMSEEQKKANFYDDCAYNESNQGTDVSGFAPDHVHEIQHGGSSVGKLVWCRDYVNSSLGGHMRGVRPGVHTKVVADCCS